jgi:hypothetical protein
MIGSPILHPVLAGKRETRPVQPCIVFIDHQVLMVIAKPVEVNMIINVMLLLRWLNQLTGGTLLPNPGTK